MAIELAAPSAPSPQLPFDANLRCIASASEPPSSIIAMFTPSTPSAPSDFEHAQVQHSDFFLEIGCHTLVGA
jgi:hypothetical protein